MSKNRTVQWVSIFSAVLLCLSGCAVKDKQLSKDDLKPINSMTMVQLNSAPLLKDTTGSTAAATTGMLFGAIGGAIGGAIQYKMMESKGKELREKYNLPNYGEQVFKRLAERIPKEVTGWPKIIVQEGSISEESEITNDYALIVKVTNLKVKDGVGLSAWTIAKLRDPKGSVLWQKFVIYESIKFQHECNLDSLEADNGKLLLEEYEFAVLNTVDNVHDIVDSFSAQDIVDQSSLTIE